MIQILLKSTYVLMTKAPLVEAGLYDYYRPFCLTIKIITDDHYNICVFRESQPDPGR